MTLPILSEQVERNILLIRGHRVMLDADLSKLYGVPTKSLNQAVKRNTTRFPADFMFQLTPAETTALRSQFVTSKNRGGRQYRPYVFTEQGVAMLSSVLRSKQAVHVNIEIMRAFVRVRFSMEENRDLSKKLKELEKKYDTQFKAVFDAIRNLITPTLPKDRRKIGL